MSLREEIFEIVTKISRRLKTEEDWMATDEILSIFEKRIDEMIEDTKWIDTTSNAPRSFTVKETLKQVKEMLK